MKIFKINPDLKLSDFLVILLIGLVVFLPVITQLGYYRDDWHVAWSGYTQGPGRILDEHKIDRPFMGLVYAATYKVLGDNPLAWQFYALFCRFAGVFFLFLLVRVIWPRQRTATFFMSALFLLYPGFLQLPQASSYQVHLVGLASGICSLLLTVLFIKSKKLTLQIPLALASMLTGAVCYLIMEWMIGIEGARLILVAYLYYRDHQSTLREKIWPVLKTWIPNLVALAGFLYWRIFIFNSTRAATDIGSLASTYTRNPLPMLVRLAYETLKGTLDAVLLAWFVPLYDLANGINYTALTIAILLATVVLVVLFAFLKKVLPRSSAAGAESPLDGARSWAVHAIWVGLLISAITIFPVIAANRSVELRNTFDRYTLLASIGVAMTVTGLVFHFFQKEKTRYFLLGVLIVLSVITHYSNGVYFSRFWEYQRQLWWQLSWRAPDLEPETTIVAALPGGYRLAESYEIWGPANIIYDPEFSVKSLKVSGEILNNETLVSVQNRDRYGRTFRRFEYMVDFSRALVVSLPSGSGCLQVYDGTDLAFPENEDAIIRLVAGNSQIDQIRSDAESHTPPVVVFGEEPARGWCYYYQQASLARQQKDWQKVVELADEAASQNLAPADVAEWMPFYEAYARLSMFDEANEIGALLRENPYFLKPYCLAHSGPQPQGDSTAKFLVSNLCPEN